jgi:DNA invertase Pin-like site-specific DNA recombinase
MQVAKAKGRLRGKQPKLSKKQEAHLVSLHRQGTHTKVELAELFSVARSTIYRTIKRAGDTIQPLSGHIKGWHLALTKRRHLLLRVTGVRSGDA